MTTFKVTVPADIDKEVWQWMGENIESGGYGIYPSYPDEAWIDRRVYEFYDETDAMAFKLRWF